MDKHSQTLSFETPGQLRDWLRGNHDKKTELWVKLFKKKSGKPSITWDELVMECLCWGWIDGLKRGYDETAYLQRITPRRPKSMWSKRNCEHVKRLIETDRMEEPGLVKVQAAQADGRWDKAYAPQSEMKLPQDFLSAVNASPKARAFFPGLNRSDLYSIAFRLNDAKRPETRERRFKKYLNALKKGEKPG